MTACRSHIKKTLVASERERPDVAEQRRKWAENLAARDAARLVFLDETCTKTNMTRIYGWGPSSERVIEYVPHGHWQTTTFLSALRLKGGIVAPLVVDGALNGEIFVKWIRQELAPALKPGDIVVMDNLNVHKVKAAVEALKAVGVEVVYLPPYSPDYNPIEKIFSWFKAKLRAIKARTRDNLWNSIGAVCSLLTPEAVANCYKDCGYQLPSTA